MMQNNAQSAVDIQRTNLEKEQKNDPAPPPHVEKIPKPSRKRALNKSQIEGLALRRNIGIEPKNRDKKTVYIEHEFIEDLRDTDLNFQINLALEHLLTKHQGARLAVPGIQHLIMDLEEILQELKQLKDSGRLS